MCVRRRMGSDICPGCIPGPGVYGQHLGSSGEAGHDPGALWRPSFLGASATSSIAARPTTE